LKCRVICYWETLNVAKAKAEKKKSKPGKDNAIVRYLRDTRAELRRVNWPTRQEAWNLTKIVLVVTISMAILLGTLDYLFALELGGVVTGSAIAIGVAVVVIVASIVVVVILSRQAAH
jgi:preprotein translocase subunit SecE